MQFKSVITRISPLFRVPTGVLIDGLGSVEVIVRFIGVAFSGTIILWSIVGITSAVFLGALFSFLLLTLTEIFGEARGIAGENPFGGKPWRRIIALGLCAVAALFNVCVMMAAAVTEFIEPSASLGSVLPLLVFAYITGMWSVEYSIRVLRFARLSWRR